MKFFLVFLLALSPLAGRANGAITYSLDKAMKYKDAIRYVFSRTDNLIYTENDVRIMARLLKRPTHAHQKYLDLRTTSNPPNRKRIDFFIYTSDHVQFKVIETPASAKILDAGSFRSELGKEGYRWLDPNFHDYPTIIKAMFQDLRGAALPEASLVKLEERLLNKEVLDIPIQNALDYGPMLLQKTRVPKEFDRLDRAVLFRAENLPNGPYDDWYAFKEIDGNLEEIKMESNLRHSLVIRLIDKNGLYIDVPTSNKKVKKAIDRIISDMQ